MGSFVTELPRGGRAMVIEGEAGAGKTAIWEAALVAARDAGVTTLGARPAEAETAWSYAALRDLLEARRAALEGLPAPQARALAAALLLADAAEATPDQQVVALAALGALRALAGKGPLLVAVDDISGRCLVGPAVLSFVARRPSRRVQSALLLALRTPGGEPARLGLEARPPAERLSAARAAGSRPRRREPPPPADQLDYVPARPVLHRLHELSAGNPFFAARLGRALRAPARCGSSPGSACRSRWTRLWRPASAASPPGPSAPSPPQPRWPCRPSSWSPPSPVNRARLWTRPSAPHRGPERGACALRPPSARLRGLRGGRSAAAPGAPLRGRLPRERQRGTRPPPRAWPPAGPTRRSRAHSRTPPGERSRAGPRCCRRAVRASRPADPAGARHRRRTSHDGCRLQHLPAR